MKKIIGALIAFTSFTAFSQYDQLVWSDEFDGTTIDLTKWSFQTGNGCPDLCGWGNSELESYTDDDKNISVENGILTITAVEESIGGSSFSSSKLLTLGKHSWKYGRFEARMRMPLGNGLWPAFWMLSTVNQWPTTGEIDIMEYRGDKPRQTDGTLHYGETWPNNRYDGTSYNHTADLSDDFHVYAVEWDENQIQWFFDDVLIKTETQVPNTLNPESNSTNKWPWNTEFYIILNLAVGGTFTGATSADEIELTKPTFEVDYIRVYSEVEPDPVAVPGKLEAEDYFSMEGVGIEDTDDLGGGSNIGYIDNNDWIEYDVTVASTSEYDFLFRSASLEAGGTVAIEVDGVQIGDDIDLPVTFDWQGWNSTTVENVSLTEGSHTLRFTFVEGSVNLNYVEITDALISGAGNSTPEVMSIYPSYFNNETSISVNSANNSPLLLKAINQGGVEVFRSQEFKTNETFKFGSELASGTYFLYFVYDEKMTVSKITKL